MKRQDPRQRRRRGRFAVLIPLIVGSITVLAASQPFPRSEGAVLALVGEPARAVATADAGVPSHRTILVPAETIFEPLPASSPPSRPVIKVSQPTPGIVVRAQTTVGTKVTAGTKVAGGTRAVFLGDSYTTGWNGAGLGSRGWPRIVSRARGWQTVNLAVAGTGFINPGWTNQPVGSRVTEAIRQKPDVVFIAAGHNDSRWSVTATAGAADKVIARLQKALPNALLVIVAPIWPSGSPPTRCLALRDHLRRTAASVGAVFIDPLGERWFAGSNERFIGPDGIHPTDAGHRHIAALVLADLAKTQ
jgi:lysophospholipase L1-like esterase